MSLTALAHGCSSNSEGIAESRPAATTVKYDFFHKPLPEIPMPNDVATVVDSSSATGRRINASMVAPTYFERQTRELTDKLDGWGVFQPITIPFSGPLDLSSVRAGHSDSYEHTENDVVYVIDIDRKSAHFGELQYVDVGNGSYPIVLENRNNYWDNDTRGDNMTILYEEVDEDVNGNGVLDPGEDTDADGILDKPNYYSGAHPASSDLAGRADATLSFYERETNTLILRLLKPLRERTTYAVVVTRRIKDEAGNPVGSPYPNINHTAQTEALRPLAEVIAPYGLAMSDVAFAFTYTTQSVESHWRAVRDGVYGYGVQRHLSEEFPAKVTRLLPLRDNPEIKRNYILWGENWQALARPLVSQFLDVNPNSQQYRELANSLPYIDYFVTGVYDSPQLFPRLDGTTDTKPAFFPRPDETGNLLPLNAQSWPPDLDRVPAKAYHEPIYFTLCVPRKEVSPRGQGKPATVAILSHGYGSTRFELMQVAGWFARHGMATIAIDGPSHGIGISRDQENLARALLGQLGYSGLAEATLSDRAFDQDNDGEKDGGADFWSAYLFHTRDVVRQFMLDYTQLIRIMRSWDGHQTWGFDEDLGRDGVPDIAGDFDGDGVVDIGGPDGKFVMAGGSLGGIMSMIMAGAEPSISAIAPISGGGGYSDIGMRTEQGGAIEAFVLRMMGPLFTGTTDANGVMTVQTVVTDLNNDSRFRLGSIAGVHPRDTLVVQDLVSGHVGCGMVGQDGRVRASLQADKGDRVRVVIYAGPVLIPGTECGLSASAVEIGRIENFDSDFTYHGEPFHSGEPLRSLEDGLGRPRSTPEIRRLASFGQLILDPGDPVVYGPHILDEPVEYPTTHEKTGAHALILTSQGDMNVPASSGLTYARAAGIVEYLQPDPRYGRSQNQVIVDTYTAEAVDNLKRFTDNTGKGVHMDIENFSGGDDFWTPTYTGGVLANAPRAAGLDIENLRLNPPLRSGFDRTDKLGGKSAAIFPLVNDTGQHGFDFPGVLTDKVRARCQQECQIGGSGDPCGCRTLKPYDIGNQLINMAGHYLATLGQELNPDLCNSRVDCDYIPAPPAERDAADLP